MLRGTWKPVAILAAGALLSLGLGTLRPGSPARAQDSAAPAAEPATLTAAEDSTSAEWAMALLRAVGGASYTPPACAAGPRMFTDVPASSPFCPWIEELARRGITGGCTPPTKYCPGQPVTRAQMAVFIVRSMETCPTLDPTDEMIRVGGVCIDKYEASLWDAPVGGNQITGPIPCNINGQNCDNIYARSVAGVQPRGDITWFQAQAALANSGKRLPTSAEWQMAVLDTPDPGSAPGPEGCNTNSSGPESTGERTNCASRWGHRDMVGNLLEWVADWDEQAAGCQVWPTDFGDDVTCIGRMDGDGSNHFPGALLRGGSWAYSGFAGPFAVIGSQPSGSDMSFGFRGAR